MVSTARDGRVTGAADGALPPLWFSRAVAARPDAIDLDRDGRTIRAYRWGDPGGRLLLLVHGMGAGAHWWDHVAPQLAAPGTQVLAVDLAGHGDSSYQEEYSLAGWAGDVMAAAAAASPDPPVLIGHSVGGRVAWKAAEQHGPALQAVVTIDSPLPRPAAAPPPGGPQRRPRQQHRVYPSREEIIRRFRPRPDQDVILPYVLDYIAGHSVRPDGEGWTWNHDYRVYASRPPEEITAGLRGCPLYILGAQYGRSDAAAAAAIRREIPQLVTATIPDAGHHVMLDQPLALVALLRLITDLALPGADPG